MSEVTESGALSLERAVRTIEEAASYEEPLRRRTQGATWMVWGLVTVALFLTSEFISRGVFPWPWFFALFLPWIAAGVATTSAIWRIAAVTVPAVRSSRRDVLRMSLGSVGISIVAFFVVLLGSLAIGPIRGLPSWLLLAAALWGLTAAINPRRVSPDGQLVIVGIALGLFVIGVLWAIVAPFDEAKSETTTEFMLAAIAGGLVPLVGGLWRTMRG